MKTNLFITLGLGLLSSLGVSAQYTVTSLNQEQQHADVSLMDWDNDGDLDLLIGGETGGSNSIITLSAYLNDGTGTFAGAMVPFTPVTRSAFDWNDFNRDGNPDLLENGFGPSGIFTGIYNSNGSSAFTVDTTVLPQMSPTSGFADFNNDGYQDIYIFGNNDQGKSKILINNKTGGFTDLHAFDTYNFHFDPDVSVADIDNDKDLDLLVSSHDFDPASTKFMRIFTNDNTVFTEMEFTPAEMGYGSSVWGDYDGDGYLDLLVNGDGDDNAYFSYKLYKNNSGTSFTLVDSLKYGQFSTGGGGRFLDWDNDGDLDMIVTGWTGDRQATAIYLNNAGTFTQDPNNATLPGVSESSIEVGDIDNDADLDVVITGFSGNDFDGGGTVGPYNKNVSLVITNPATPNLPPSAPSNIHVTGTQSATMFSWDAATDATTPTDALSYNIYVADDQGHTFVFSNSDTTTGKLRLQRLGNVQLNKGWVLHDLPAGNYHWGVQAVDNSFMGSSFARGTFVVNVDGTLPISLSSYNVSAENQKAKIKWTTSLEQNNDYFEIYRSDDGINFTLLEKVKSKGTGSHQYFVYDNNPSSGVNYYRLLQYDADGHAKDQGIKTVTMYLNGKSSVIAFPNPSYGEVGIRLNNYKGRLINVSMSDMMGKQIHTEKIPVNDSRGYYTLHLKTRPLSGQYIVNVNGDNLKESLKVVIR